MLKFRAIAAKRTSSVLKFRTAAVLKFKTGSVLKFRTSSALECKYIREGYLPAFHRGAMVQGRLTSFLFRWGFDFDPPRAIKRLLPILTLHFFGEARETSINFRLDLQSPQVDPVKKIYIDIPTKI